MNPVEWQSRWASNQESNINLMIHESGSEIRLDTLFGRTMKMDRSQMGEVADYLDALARNFREFVSEDEDPVDVPWRDMGSCCSTCIATPGYSFQHRTLGVDCCCIHQHDLAVKEKAAKDG